MANDLYFNKVNLKFLFNSSQCRWCLVKSASLLCVTVSVTMYYVRVTDWLYLTSCFCCFYMSACWLVFSTNRCTWSGCPKEDMLLLTYFYKTSNLLARRVLPHPPICWVLGWADSQSEIWQWIKKSTVWWHFRPCRHCFNKLVEHCLSQIC